MNKEFQKFLGDRSLVDMFIKKLNKLISVTPALKEKKKNVYNQDSFMNELLSELYFFILNNKKEELMKKMNALFLAVKENQQDRLNEELNYLLRSFINHLKDSTRSELGSFPNLYHKIQTIISHYRRDQVYINGQMYGKKGMLPNALIYPKAADGHFTDIDDIEHLEFTCDLPPFKEFFTENGEKLRKENFLLLLDNLYPEYLDFYEKKLLFYNLMAIQLYVQKLCANYSFLKSTPYSIVGNSEDGEDDGGYEFPYAISEEKIPNASEYSLPELEAKEISCIVKDRYMQIPYSVRQCYYLNENGRTFAEISDMLELKGSQNARNRAKKFPEYLSSLFLEQNWNAEESDFAAEFALELLKSDFFVRN